MASIPTPDGVLKAIESYLATRVSRGDPQAKALHRMLLPLLLSPTKEASQANAEAFEDILDSMAEAGAFDAEAERAIEQHFSASDEPFGIERARENVVQRLMSAYSGLPISDRVTAEAKQRQALLRVDAAAEALISRLDHAGSLESPNIKRPAYELRLAVAIATGDFARVEAASQSLDELLAEDPDLQDEARNARVAALPGLQKQAGAAYTFYMVANKALQEASGDAREVDWDQVHQDVFAKAVGQDKQPVAQVLDAIKLHSPGAVTPDQIEEIEVLSEARAIAQNNAIAVTFESRWEEGVISTSAYLDLDTGIVFGIADSDAGSEYEHLQGEFVLVGDREVAVELEPDNNYRIDAPTLAAIKVEVKESATKPVASRDDGPSI